MTPSTHDPYAIHEPPTLGRREVAAVVFGWAVVALIRVLETEGRPGIGYYLLVTIPVWAGWTFLLIEVAKRLIPLRERIPQKVLAVVALGHLLAFIQDTWAILAWNWFLRSGRRRSSVGHILEEQFEDFWGLQSLEIVALGLLLGIGLLWVTHAQVSAEQKRSADLAAQVSDARMEAMRMQLNPHFFFNTLHAVSSYIKTEPDKAQHMIVRLGDLMRGTFTNTGRLERTVQQEIEFIEAYADIMRARVGDRLRLSVSLPPELRDAMLPELILQPLVENSVNHGIEASSTAGLIEIQVKREGERLVVSVRDDGPGLNSEVDQGEGVGLQNVRQRLNLLYGNNQQLVVLDHADGGVEARIELPFHTETDLVFDGEA